MPEPPRDMLMTSAGFGLAGTPATVPPAAHTTASAMSDSEPPHLPSTRMGWIFAFGATPTTPWESATAATVPATWVPCHEESEAPAVPHSPAAYQSPSSRGLESRPPPSRAAALLEMKS